MKVKLFFWTWAGIIVMLFSVVLALSIGSANIPVMDVWKILLGHAPLIGTYIPADSNPQSWE